MCFRDRIQRPGEFVIFMLSIIIEKEDFEDNCHYKTRWDSYPGIGEEKKSFLLKKTDPTFCTPFLFIKYSKTTH